ncbi:hypothetical protein PENTCL1PPCAC_470, partial [Pristionchus entomophagus]
IIVPSFKVESKLCGKEVLMKLGITNIFSRDKADFSKISDIRFYVSAIHHKATIEINEHGTEASAATAMTSTRKRPRPPPVIVFDRPFLFGITHNQHILFIGQF